MNTPNIRFKGFSDDWEQQKLSDIYKDIGNAFVGTATPYYVEEGHFYLESNNIKDGQINHNTEVFINDEFYERQKDKWLHTGDMVMVQSGHVGHAAVIPEELDCSAAHALIMFRNPKVEIEPYFLNFQYQTTKSKKKLENITTGNTIKHILASEMQEFVVDVTSYVEQAKIAGLFTDLDNLITLHQRKCDSLKQVKKYMLQKMFPKQGEKVPEIRFVGFTGDWEQRKVSEITKFHKQGFYTTEEYDDYKKYYLLRGTDLTENKLVLKDTPKINATEKDYQAFKTEVGDFLIVRSGTVGTYGIVYDNIPAIFGSYLIDFRFDMEQVTNEFFGYFYQSEYFKIQLRQIVQQSANTNINAENIKSTSIMLPTLVEQQKISEYMINLDNLITLHQRKSDSLKEIKKFMLQNMFP